MIPNVRAWDKVNKEMIEDVTSIHFKAEMIVTRNLCFYPFKDIELMQSTGLFDKNGKEIFEGDILHHKVQGTGVVFYPYRDNMASFGIRNIENNFGTTLRDTAKAGYEIIGNKFEHRHLLGED
ncbi:YopX family protein [Mammaliicoccus sciuri]|uniref:YopX family protein n=1 Tax=Mammaliicoccus sciuri TaxID=1296 RepID=UPI003F5666AE